MTATQGQTIKQLASVDLPPSLAALQMWRNADHEDTIRLTRDDVVTLIEETRAQLADAQAAQAMVVEKAAKKLESRAELLVQDEGSLEPDTNVVNLPEWAESECEVLEESARLIRALAPIDGLALVRELRAESETRHQLHLEQVRITNEWIAERDRLAAANAVLEAKVAGLVEVLEFYAPKEVAGIKFAGGDDAGHRALAALATQEAGK